MIYGNSVNYEFSLVGGKMVASMFVFLALACLPLVPCLTLIFITCLLLIA